MQASHVAPTYENEGEEWGTSLWWLLLITGSLWILFSLVVFRFDYKSVAAISIVTGAVCIAAAVGEVFAAMLTHGWARVGFFVLAAAFTVVGIICFVHPGDSFRALAAVFAFYLLFRGIYDVVVALVVRGDLWWLWLLGGIAQILLAFWAAGDFGHKAFLLIVWVGASSLANGILQIIAAFELRPRRTG